MSLLSLAQPSRLGLRDLEMLYCRHLIPKPLVLNPQYNRNPLKSPINTYIYIYNMRILLGTLNNTRGFLIRFLHYRTSEVAVAFSTPRRLS